MNVEELIRILEKLPKHSDVVLRAEDCFGDLFRDTLGLVELSKEYDKDCDVDTYVSLLGDSTCYLDGGED